MFARVGVRLATSEVLHGKVAVKLFVWDLHGVLEIGNDRAVIDVSNEALFQFGHSARFTYEDGVRLYGLRWYEYFEHLLPDASHEHHIELQEACFKLSEERPDLQYRWIKQTPYAETVLIAIGEHHRQILISNTRAATLDMFLKLLEIEQFFPDGQAVAVDQHVKNATATKRDALASYLTAHGAFDELIIIGDSPADMRLADASGGITYLYAHPGFAFRDCDASFKIRDLRCVLDHL
jgi:phosphoglycolate phosphatase-like HAD superfamily hydrolase